MTLGEKISELRNSKNMSQSDLAEKLDVSRQSVSKWETNTSIPELDKLIILSDIFGITLDELVMHKTNEQTNAEQNKTKPEPVQAEMKQQIVIQRSVSTQKIIGYILLGLGLLCCILALIFGRTLVFIGGYIVFCSLICLIVKQHAIPIIGWMTLLFLIIFGPYIIGYNFLASFAVLIIFALLTFYLGHLIFKNIKNRKTK